MLGFVNAYTALSYAAFYKKNFQGVAISLTYVLAGKQIYMNLKEYYSYKNGVGKKLRKVDNYYNAQINDHTDKLLKEKLELEKKIHR